MASRAPKKPALTLDASLVQDDLPLEVIPKIFVGSIHSAFNLDCLVSNGITHILNASRLPVTFPKQFTYLSVEIRDRGVSNILSCIPTTNIFIEAGVDNGGVLVHCFGGKSRSPAFIAAYLMSSRSWPFDHAYNVIKAARPIIDINPGFECQLRAYESAGCDVYIAQQLLLRTRVRELGLLRGDAVVLAGDCKVSEHIGYSQAVTATANLHSMGYNQRNNSISNTDMNMTRVTAAGINAGPGNNNNSSNSESSKYAADNSDRYNHSTNTDNTTSNNSEAKSGFNAHPADDSKGFIDTARIPAGVRMSGRFDLSKACSSDSQDGGEHMKGLSLNVMSAADKPKNNNSPLLLAATAATYDATAVNTEHEHYFMDMHANSSNQQQQQQHHSGEGANNNSSSGNAVIGGAGAGSGAGQSHKKRALNASRPQSHENPLRVTDDSSSNSNSISPTSGINSNDGTAATTAAAAAVGGRISVGSNMIMLGTTGGYQEEDGDNDNAVDDDDDDDNGGAMDIDTTDGQEERTIQNLAAAYDTITAHAAMRGSVGVDTGGDNMMVQVQLASSQSADAAELMAQEQGLSTDVAGGVGDGSSSRRPSSSDGSNSHSTQSRSSSQRPQLSLNVGEANNGVTVNGIMSAPKGSSAATGGGSGGNGGGVMLLSAVDRARIITEVGSPTLKTYSASPNTITQAMQMHISTSGSQSAGGKPAAISTYAVGGPSTLTGGGISINNSSSSSSSSSSRWGDRDSSGNRTSRHSKSSRKGGRGRSSTTSSSTAEVEVKTPICRLSQPGSHWVRVIPPLRGLEREFKCSWCNTTLFTFANVIRPDLDLVDLLDRFLTKNRPGSSNSSSSAGHVSSVAPAKDDPANTSTTANSVSGGSDVPPLVITGANGEIVIPTGPRSARSLEEKHSFRYNETADDDAGTVAAGGSTSVTSPTNSRKLDMAPPTPRTLQRQQQQQQGGDSTVVLGLTPRSAALKKQQNDAKPTGTDSSNSIIANNPLPSSLASSPASSSESVSGGNMVTNIASPKGSNILKSAAINNSNSSSRNNDAGSDNINSNINGGGSAKNSPRFETGDNEMEIDSTPRPGSAKMLACDDDDDDNYHAGGDGEDGVGEAMQQQYNHNHNQVSRISPSRQVQFAPVGMSRASAAASKHPMGPGFGFIGAAGQRTSRAAQAKGFDFDIPTVDSHDMGSGSLSPTQQDHLVSSSTADSKSSQNSNFRSETSQQPASDHRKLLQENPDALPFVLNTQANDLGYGVATGGRAFSMIDTNYVYDGNNPGASAGAGAGSSSSAGQSGRVVTDTSSGGASTDSSAAAAAAIAPAGSSSLNRGLMPPRAASMVEFGTDESPRVAVPPHRLHEQQWSAYFAGRPQSAEKRRWLARMNLLRNGDVKVAKMADDDDSASINAFGRNKYLHIEYLDWMGLEVFQQDKDAGNIQCFSCKKAIGAWTWKPSDRLSQDLKLEAPIFRIHKHVVHHSDVFFDATPRSTPRSTPHPEDMMGGGSGSGPTSRAASRESSREGPV